MVHKPAHKLVSTKVIIGAQCLHLLPVERMALLLTYKVPHKMTIHTNRAGACGGIVLKTLQYILIKLQHVTWSSSPRSLQVYLFPIGNSRQKQTYNNLDTHCSENACDKPSVLPCRCHALHYMPGECWQFSPGEALHVDVNLITAHTLLRFWLSKHVIRSMRNNWHAHWLSKLLSFQAVSLSAVYRGRSLNVWTPGLNWYLKKLFFLLLFFFYFIKYMWYTSVVLLDFQP